MCVQYVNTKFSNVNAIVNLCSKFYNKLTFENVIGIMTHFMYISYYIHISHLGTGAMVEERGAAGNKDNTRLRARTRQIALACMLQVIYNMRVSE